jgi:hypothetical protein
MKRRKRLSLQNRKLGHCVEQGQSSTRLLVGLLSKDGKDWHTGSSLRLSIPKNWIEVVFAGLPGLFPILSTIASTVFVAFC